MHKVLTYVEYGAASRVFQNIDPPPLHPASVYPSHTLAGRSVEGGGGQYFGKTRDIGLTSYSIISLRVHGLPTCSKDDPRPPPPPPSSRTAAAAGREGTGGSGTPSSNKKRCCYQCSGSMTFWCGSGSRDPCL
jgi:hypothetical protein